VGKGAVVGGGLCGGFGAGGLGGVWGLILGGEAGVRSGVGNQSNKNCRIESRLRPA
jgi:hypothetical protein